MQSHGSLLLRKESTAVKIWRYVDKARKDGLDDRAKGTFQNTYTETTQLFGMRES